MEIVLLDKLFNAMAFRSMVRKEIGHFHLLDLKFWRIFGKRKNKGIIGAQDLQQVNVKQRSRSREGNVNFNGNCFQRNSSYAAKVQQV